MGWFWADTASSPSAATAPHPLPRNGASPPPSCPMHNKNSKPRLPDTTSTPPGACPYNPPDVPTPASSSSTTTSPPASTGLLSRLNPLNNMPFQLSNQKSATQTVDLPLERETSTIPKGDGSLWEYPSPQQMYNAMLRKGYTDTPQDAVESMVAVHNFLNEGAWAEIVGWEARFARGLSRGWEVCKRGEENADRTLRREPMSTDWSLDTSEDKVPPPQLVRFTGRPNDPTPKSQLLQLLSKAAPKTFGGEPPFDRHDWFVKRCDKEGACKELRYVIDYYEGPPEPTGEPVFYLDVRPAVDGPGQAMERLMRWGGDCWWRASGGAVREEARLKEKIRARS